VDFDYEFVWPKKNVEHIDEHNITPREAEYIVNHNPYRPVGNKKYLAVGQTPQGRWIQVVYAFDVFDRVCVIHARDLSDREKQRVRRRRR
jgi:uncharacterized DUF497 family protein